MLNCTRIFTLARLAACFAPALMSQTDSSASMPFYQTIDRELDAAIQVSIAAVAESHPLRPEAQQQLAQAVAGLNIHGFDAPTQDNGIILRDAGVAALPVIEKLLLDPAAVTRRRAAFAIGLVWPRKKDSRSWSQRAEMERVLLPLLRRTVLDRDVDTRLLALVNIDVVGKAVLARDRCVPSALRSALEQAESRDPDAGLRVRALHVMESLGLRSSHETEAD